MEKGLKEKLLQLIREEAYNPLTAREFADIFDIHESERPLFYEHLDEMVQDGLLYMTKNKRYGLPQKMNLFVGRLDVTQRGFGFIESTEEGVEDLFVASSDINGAMHGDKVIARVTKQGAKGRRSEGEIIKVIERGYSTIVGRFEVSKKFGFVIPDEKKFNMDIYVSKGLSMKANDGDKVVCKIIKWPERGRSPEGEIIEILGKGGVPEVEVLSIIRQHGIPENFPKKVQREVDGIEETIPAAEIQRRKDIRDMTTFTIDGADAKDLDDAVSIEMLSNGNYRLGVHIADVTNYVKENSKLDREALKRGTSVYFADRVIPMLPPKLSNGLCSLNPDVDRLALSVFMEIDNSANVVSHEIAETVIRSKARLIYEDISDILEKGEMEDTAHLFEKYSHIIDDFTKMETLARLLMKRRDNRGAIDFDFPEAKIIFDEKGHVDDIKKYDRRIANRIIEEFMLICNETVAEEFFWLSMPFVYRIHETPDREKMEDFNKFISTFGYVVKGSLDEVHPKALQDLLHQIRGKKEELAVSMIMLRSLKQAKYAPNCTGHFGLAAKYYSHFTSPIRRYPDLQIHRIIKEFLNGQIDGKRQNELKEIVAKSSEQSSLREREAETAEREVEDLKKAEYMRDHVGKVYEGFISGVTSFGIFVELDNTVEGLVRLSSMSDDYYIFDSEKYTVIGEHRKKMYRIGDTIKVKVDRVDLDRREIEFMMA
ncbi:ribonuclease R [Peptoclostridium litorale DSM 5388]|uniref:Ribonuclease R n=1 Tax=Peptoclostridium litorale DSM 5388 TaxID=1121324 RepID=A0A069R9Z6_PEPLI|nr:ribonuclease R [Peptoclostridium litorale]KDR93899.1 ribonuclease R [Peptoclostridium litorale DSM 5388]KDR95326.1 ribonuclease R [Peptoclostridium litorale DSM 5388]SIN88150.1 ribonuclease R [Peptoclostridium litorale DSM 5388]